MDRLTEVRDAFTQLWGTLGPFWGVSPTTARIFGWLLSQPEGADAEEVMKGLDLSRGAVSMGCKELREWGLIYLEKAPGSRRQIYVPESDLMRVTRNVAQIRKRREWDPIREHLAEWIPALEADDSSEAKIFAQRLRAIEALVVMADSMAEVLLTGGSIGKFGFKALLRAGKRAADSGRENPDDPDDSDDSSEGESALASMTPDPPQDESRPAPGA